MNSVLRKIGRWVKDMFMGVPKIEWEDVTECVTCPLKYRTGCKLMCNLGIGEIPQKGISHNCPAIRYDTRLLKKRKSA